MAWAAIPAFLRTRFNTNEILVTLMLTYVATLLLSWLVHGPWRDPEGFNFPQTALFAGGALLPSLLDQAYAAQLIGLHHRRSRCSPMWVFSRPSFLGFQMRGRRRRAARRALCRLLATRGDLDRPADRRRCGGPRRHGGGGRADRPAVADTSRPAMASPRSSSPSSAGCIPFGIVLASLLMSLLYLGGEAAQMTLGLPSALTRVFQGMLLFFLLAADFFIHYRRAPDAGGALMDLFIAIFTATIVAATPLMFAALGELVIEKSGVLNLGVEGMMLIGAALALRRRRSPAMPLPLASLAAIAGGRAHRRCCSPSWRSPSSPTSLPPAWRWRSSARACRRSIGSRFGSVADRALGTLRIPVLSDLPVLGPLLFRFDLLVYLACCCSPPSAGSCTAPRPAWCCARSANRRQPRMRSAIR